MRAAVAWVDFGTASVSAFGTLAALIARRETGRGQKVEAALLRTAVAFTNSALLEQQVIQVNRIATLNRGQTSAPSDVFRTKDGWIIAYAIGNPMFRRWARLMGEEHWLTDPRFKDDRGRGAQKKKKKERTTDEALAELEKAKVPAGPLLTAAGARGRAHPRGGLAPRHRLSRPAAARAAGADTGGSVRDAGPLRSSRSDARRAHGRDPEPRSSTRGHRASR